MGRTQHYKLPYDDEHDKDIIDWINSFGRNKKGEMVRHAIRYYMSQLEEGESIKFPDSPSNNANQVVRSKPVVEQRKPSQAEVNKRERQRPSILNPK